MINNESKNNFVEFGVSFMKLRSSASLVYEGLYHTKYIFAIMLIHGSSQVKINGSGQCSPSWSFAI